MKTPVYLLLAVITFASGQEIDDTISSSNNSPTGDASPSPANIVCDGIVTCESTYDPVCTSKGTFRNACEFKNAYCEKPSTDFYIVPCGSETLITTQSVEEEETKGSVSKEVLDVPIELDDITNPMVHENGGLEAPIVGDVPEESGDINGVIPSDSETPRPVIDCTNGSLACDFPDDPVCASNGFTFIHECHFKNKYCESPSDALFIVRKGPCDSTDVPLQVQSLSAEEREIWGTVFDVPVELDDQTSVTIACDDGHVHRSDAYEPVCSSDGRTFSNEYHFKNAYCEQPDAGLHIVSKGQCPTSTIQTQTTNDGVSPDVLDVPIELDDVAVDADVNNDAHRPPETSARKSNPYCTLVCPTGKVRVAPLCGTDARSYINDCHLLSTKCEQPNLEKQYDGLCVVGQAPTTPSGVSTNSASLMTQESVARPNCNSFCGRHYKPMCGSNGVTYANECLLEFAHCQDPHITPFSAGECATIHSSSIADEQPSSAACVPSVCPGTEAPVCGSDGQTYHNVCLLNNARCQIPDLTVAHDGECGAKTKLTCGTLTCPRFSKCMEDPVYKVAHCVDVCHKDRCGPNATCKLLESVCYTAPCSPVATCVPNGNDYAQDY